MSIVRFYWFSSFFKWGISFGEPFQMPDNGSRPVKYASKKSLVQTIQELFHPEKLEQDRKKPGKVLKFTPMEMVDPEELKARIRGTKEGDADEQT